VQADTLIPSPGNPQSWDRFAYVYNNPLSYVDPSGHCGVLQGTFDGEYDCTEDDINEATMEQRLAWFKEFIATTGRAEWFKNIVGILQAFIDEGLGESNSWLSWVDTGILVSIQNGWALFASKQTNDNPADIAWKDFFASSGETVMKEKWGAAEKRGTEYGLSLANIHGAAINKREQLFLKVGDNLYRNLLTSGQMEEFYGQLAADIGSSYCNPTNNGFCSGWVDSFRSAGSSFGEWFGDPRSTILNIPPVYFLARLILEK